MRNSFLELLDRNLEKNPDGAAYICGDDILTYRELDSSSRLFSKLLREKGILPGERILIALTDCFAFPAAFLGCLIAGVVAVPVSSSLREQDYRYIMDDCGARLVVTHHDQAVILSAANCRCGAIICDCSGPLEYPANDRISIDIYTPSEDDFAFMLYSSGSTGTPKGIPHSHPDLIMPCELVGKNILGIKSDDVLFSTSKLSFSYGLINSLAFPLYFGATAVLHPGKPDSAAIIDIFEKKRPTVLFSVPSVYADILEIYSSRRIEPGLRICFSAGEPLPSHLFDTWHQLTGLEIIDGVGSTELTYVFIANRPGNVVRGSIGRLVDGYNAKIVDQDGFDVAQGIDGQLLIGGASITPFYWNQPDKTAETFRNDGLMLTGDVFSEVNGQYFYKGRMDDMIKSGDHWVSPVPVEEIIRNHVSVADCAVAAINIGGLSKPGIFIVLAQGIGYSPLLESDLRIYVHDCLPAHMCPARYTFLDDLPRTDTGKIQRFKLREAS